MFKENREKESKEGKRETKGGERNERIWDKINLKNAENHGPKEIG